MVMFRNECRQPRGAGLEMTNNYYEPELEDPCRKCKYNGDYPCDCCKWMDVVDCDDPPCCYCEHYGEDEPPEGFNYDKLKGDKLE